MDKQDTPATRRLSLDLVTKPACDYITPITLKGEITVKMEPQKTSQIKNNRLKYASLAAGFGVVLLLVGYVSNHFASQYDTTGFPGLHDTKFTLISHEGNAVSNTDLLGKPTVIYFGFTYCPDICPTTLSLLADLVDDIGTPEAYQLVLVTVDPVRDTPEALKDYLSLFDADILGLTEREDVLADMLKDFGIYRAVADDGLGNKTIDHTSSVFLFYEDGRMKGTISPAEPYEFALQKLVDLKR